MKYKTKRSGKKFYLKKLIREKNSLSKQLAEINNKIEDLIGQKTISQTKNITKKDSFKEIVKEKFNQLIQFAEEEIKINKK